MSLFDAMEILDAAGLSVDIHDKDLRELRVTDGRGLEEHVDLARGQRLTLRALDALAQHRGV